MRGGVLGGEALELLEGEGGLADGDLPLVADEGVEPELGGGAA